MKSEDREMVSKKERRAAPEPGLAKMLSGALDKFRKKKFYTKDVLTAANYRIGEYTYGKPDIFQWEKARLIIGKFCSIAEEVKIFLGGNHRTDWVTTYPFSDLAHEWPEARDVVGHPATKGDVVIGNDVWLGYGATVLSGVRIADGAVVGARAVVTKDVAPYTIVGGSPAVELKKRFDDHTIEKLLEIQWWNWPEEKIRKYITVLCSDNLAALFEAR